MNSIGPFGPFWAILGLCSLGFINLIPNPIWAQINLDFKPIKILIHNQYLGPIHLYIIIHNNYI